MRASNTPAILAENLTFAWPGEPSALLQIRAFEVAAGERVFLRGPSGSGKSTLLGLIAGVLEPQQGALHLLGHDLTTLSARQRDALRARDLGVVFQMFNLLPFLSVLQNVTLACTFAPERKARLSSAPEEDARKLLARLGLTDEALLERAVSALSVGQQQRVATARALLGGPKLVIADEPTSALDADARANFLELLFEEVARTGAALLMVSHDASLADQFDRSYDLTELNKASKPAGAAQ